MQSFVFLATFFLVEKKGPQKERKKPTNAKYYGHYVALAHALRSDQLRLTYIKKKHNVEHVRARVLT